MIDHDMRSELKGIELEYRGVIILVEAQHQIACAALLDTAKILLVSQDIPCCTLVNMLHNADLLALLFGIFLINALDRP
jgi:hypothetical protein